MREFNKDAHIGFDALTEWFGDRPRSLEAFLRTFKRHIDGRLGSCCGPNKFGRSQLVPASMRNVGKVASESPADGGRRSFPSAGYRYNRLVSYKGAPRFRI